MIGVRLMGGLGNQMFQYAAAKNLAELRGTSVAMDLIFFENILESDTPRIFELDCFKLKANIIEPNKRPDETLNEAYHGARGALRFTKHRFAGKAWKIYREPHHNYDKHTLELPNYSYLIGYWQTERYFKNIRSDLLKDFSYRSEPDSKNRKILQLIQSCNAVSLHVRRGDYISNPNSNKFHGAKDIAYYQSALNLILKKTKQPVLFVFSDDPAWCKQNLKFAYETHYIEGNKKGFDDMRLMSQCKHNIIANSSFSWWAAWLNQNPGKIIVAPEKWFNDPSVNVKDVLPASWLKI